MREQYQPRHAKKQKVRLPLSAYLLYLLIATLIFTGVSFSKFASTGNASDGARVAVVMVDGSGYSEEPEDLTLGGDSELTTSYEFYVTNYNDEVVSEVSLAYTVSVTLPAELPTGVTMSLTYQYDVYDEDTGESLSQTSDCTSVTSEEPGVYTFEGGDILDAGSWEYHSYTLTFSMEEGAVEGEYQYDDVTISVTAEQID